MGTEPLSLFLGRISGPFSAVSGGPGDGTWLDGVGLRPWVALWIRFPSQGTTGPRPEASLLLGAVQLRNRSGAALRAFHPSTC